MKQNNTEKTEVDITLIVNKMRAYCAYQERCEQELYNKLTKLNTPPQKFNEVFSILKEEGFFNQQRFIENFVSSKINQKKWGVAKIKNALRAKGLGSTEIENAFKEIDQEAYLENFNQLAQRKWNELNEKKLKTVQQKKQSLYRFLLSKGYQSNLVSNWVFTKAI